MQLAAASTAVAGGLAGGLPVERGGATELPRAVWLRALFRDQEAERAGREHRSCALLRAE
jgi:hypothetical protein